MKTTVESLTESFEKAGIKYKVSKLVPVGIVIEDMNHLSINQLPGYNEGHFIIQDISSMCVGYFSGAKAGQTVLDVCAAPGGKATHLAECVGVTGKVIARDNQPDKLEVIQANANRLGLDNIEVALFDAMIMDDSLVGKMDVVLVDAPCSGLGIIRRKPDIKYNRSVDDIKALEGIQEKILKVAAEYVADGGVLMYSTCTLNPAENQDIVGAFLNEDQRFELEPLSDEGYLTLFPNIHQTDGFFIAKLIKTKTR
jgi:16S rRNA (cytosine967-C5)-methyltransferase